MNCDWEVEPQALDDRKWNFEPYCENSAMFVSQRCFSVISTVSYLFDSMLHFYAPQLYRQVLLRRVLAMGILSVRLSVRPSVCLSRPGGIPRPGEIETPGLHQMIA